MKMTPLPKFIQEQPNFQDFLSYVRNYEDLASELQAKSDQGDALYWALDYELDEIAMWLIENGAEANTDAVYAAAQRGNYDALKIMIEKGTPIEDYFNPGGFTPLLAACCEARKYYRGNLQVHKTVNGEQVLVTDPAEIEKIAGKDRYTNFPKIVKLLLDSGANPNKLLNTSAKQSALHFAADHGQTELARLVLEAGGNLEIRDGFGMTAISYAARKDFKNETLELFIANGANLNNQEDYGFSALHEAAENNAFKNIKSLLAAGADKTLKLKKSFNPYKVDFTPLDVAKTKNSKEAIELLS